MWNVDTLRTNYGLYSDSQVTLNVALLVYDSHFVDQWYRIHEIAQIYESSEKFYIRLT